MFIHKGIGRFLLLRLMVNFFASSSGFLSGSFMACLNPLMALPIVSPNPDNFPGPKMIRMIIKINDKVHWLEKSPEHTDISPKASCSLCDKLPHNLLVVKLFKAGIISDD